MRFNAQTMWFWLSLGILLVVSFAIYTEAAAAPARQEETVFPAAETTPTPTTTVTPTATSTETPAELLPDTVTPTPTETPAPTETQAFVPPSDIHLPLVILQPTPTATVPPLPPELSLFCSNPGRSIPDNDQAGISDTRPISDSRLVHDVNVYLDIAHTFVGDLVITLQHLETGRQVTLVDRPGLPANKDGCGENHIGAILDDEITAPVEGQCASGPAAISGIYLPQDSLASFDGEAISGNWILNVSDHSKTDTGKLKNWCLAAILGGPLPPPTPAPPPPSFPAKARIYNITAQPQALPLDCESRVAVDWAGYFGVDINEFEFFNNLPTSKNPDAGFVGNVFGTWGQIPPNPYGVHAEPVAALLRDYGLQAYAHRPLSWDDLRAEVADKRPVFAWTIGPASFNSAPVYYTSPDKHITVVAPYEHVVMVIGYDESTVTIMDGGTISHPSIHQFLSSWSALGNMAITTRP